MSIKIWTNVNLMTMTESDIPYGIIDNAALVTENDTISWIGKMGDLPDNVVGDMIDCDGKYMTPGLIDPHTHLIYGGNRIDEFEKRLNGVSYERIAKEGGGIISTVNATRAATEAELFESAAKRLGNFLKEGVTTLEIKSGYGLDTENELKMLRVAKELSDNPSIDIIPTFLGAHALPPEYAADREGYIDLIVNDMIPKVATDNLAQAVDGFCENIGFTYEEIERVFVAAKDYGLEVKLHAEQLSDQNGAALAAQFGALSADHLEHLSEDSVIAMKYASTTAVLLPGAYYTLRDTTLPPIDLLRKHGVPIAIGSDSNPGSSPALSLKLMINMACTLFMLTPEEAITGVTRNAAKALGLYDRGILREGYKADLVLWDIEHPAELAYYVGGNSACSVVKNGVVLD